MRISHSWLAELIGPLPPPEVVAGILTRQGLEVEALELAGDGLEGAVVAEVASLGNVTDRLTRVELRWDKGGAVCVTGAQNLREGDRVPYAPPGARLPDGRTLAAAEFHGVTSEGMLLSADEIGLGPDHEGILVLPDEAPLGEDVASYLGLPDAVYEIALTPSFAQHCQSARGVARELGAVLGTPPEETARETMREPKEASPRVAVEDEELSPLYVGLWLRRRKVVQTPLAMRRRLWSSGMRPLLPVVDLSNYVMLELGQPSHPFAQDKLEGIVAVRSARDGEEIETLDGVLRRLVPDDIVIADERGAAVIAGVMGAARVEVDERTERVFLEIARFSPSRIGRTMRRLGLRSEAAQRYAQGIAGDLPLRAARRLRELAPSVGWEVLPGAVAVGGVGPGAPTIAVEPGYVRTLLGIGLTAQEQAQALRRFGFTVAQAGDALAATPPPDRIDVVQPCDVAEEVLRAVGIDRLGTELPPPAPSVEEPQAYFARKEALRTWMGLGYRAAVSYSLVDPTLLAMLGQPAEVEVANALSSDASALRTTLRAGLLQAVARNLARGLEEIALVEAGRVFRRGGAQIEEEDMLGWALSGYHAPVSRFPRRQVDFFDVKGDLEAALAALRVGEAEFRQTADPALHPGRQAEVRAGGQRLGVIGELHPAIAEQFGISERTLVGEISLETLRLLRQDVAARRLPRFPALVRDVALVVDEGLPFGALRQEVREVLGGLLAQMALFDVFAGAPVPSGKKSVALRLSLQSPDRTLTEADAEAALGRLLGRLADRFGARLR